MHYSKIKRFFEQTLLKFRLRANYFLFNKDFNTLKVLWNTLKQMETLKQIQSRRLTDAYCLYLFLIFCFSLSCITLLYSSYLSGYSFIKRSQTSALRRAVKPGRNRHCGYHEYKYIPSTATSTVFYCFEQIRAYWKSLQ